MVVFIVADHADSKFVSSSELATPHFVYKFNSRATNLIDLVVRYVSRENNQCFCAV